MKQRAKIVAATGLVASMLPLAGGPAHAADLKAEDSAGSGNYGGYTAEAVATPLRLEVFEPVIPLPSEPQAELWFGYSKIVADSSSGSGRSSWLWPGSAVGEGLRVFGEQFGLPADNPLTGPGYTVQVNSQYPGDPNSAKDEPAPGMVMRTTSGEKEVRAETGFSPDGTVLGPEAGDAPQKSDNPLLGLQQQLSGLLGTLAGGAGTGGASAKTAGSTAPAAETPASPPGLGGLEALIDVDGYESVSKMDATEGPVLSASRAELGAVRLLGGLITLGGFESIAKTTTDGSTAQATGHATWGKLTIAGQEFSIGPDGAVAAGKTTALPGLGLPLDKLGISIEAPKPTRKVDGDQATSVSEGLRITIDTKVLAPIISKIPSGQLADALPPFPGQANAIKSLISAISLLKPRLVATFGYARSTVDTVPKMAPISSPPAGTDSAAGTGTAAGGGAAGGGAAGGAAATAPGGADAAPATGAGAGASDGSGVTGDLPAATQSSGLPKLNTIPGMLLLAAFAAAAVAGSWFRRLGAAALGGGAACSHGLDTGLPDLRKA
ncbi:MAG TPA: choice-of-anchor P family protein [Nocardioides sp.]|nr:choice-of-anchor P family protein [Nocardioides sp.]